MKIKLDPGVTMPTRGHMEDAGLDLYSRDKMIWIAAHEQKLIDTVVHIELPQGYYGMVTGRSSMNKEGILCITGIIDRGYTGSIGVILHNLNDYPVQILSGQRIAQLIIQPYFIPELELVSFLDDTERGDGGFGSTGR